MGDISINLSYKNYKVLDNIVKIHWRKKIKEYTLLFLDGVKLTLFHLPYYAYGLKGWVCDMREWEAQLAVRCHKPAVAAVLVVTFK